MDVNDTCSMKDSSQDKLVLPYDTAVDTWTQLLLIYLIPRNVEVEAGNNNGTASALVVFISDDRWQKVLGIQFKIYSVVYFRA